MPCFRDKPGWRLLRALVAGVFALLLPGDGGAADHLSGPIPATVTAVIDGDTLAVRVHIWLGQEVETRVRLLGVDAPELRGACPAERAAAREARARLADLTQSGSVWLEDVRADKYGGRILARVTTEAGRDLRRALLDGGLAAPYEGGRRGDWCNRLAGFEPPVR